MYLIISNVQNGDIADATGAATILDDDNAPTISINSVSNTE